MSTVKVIYSPKRHQKGHNKKHLLSIHDLPAKRSATKLAITCGKKMNATTTIAENHKRKVLIQLGLQLHCFARHDLENPKAISNTDRTSRYGRNRTTKADVPAAPAAKRKGSSGRQQLDATITLPSAARLATTVLLESDLPVAWSSFI